jgi:hypothetical protein
VALLEVVGRLHEAFESVHRSWLYPRDNVTAPDLT